MIIFFPVLAQGVKNVYKMRQDFFFYPYEVLGVSLCLINSKGLNRTFPEHAFLSYLYVMAEFNI